MLLESPDIFAFPILLLTLHVLLHLAHVTQAMSRGTLTEVYGALGERSLPVRLFRPAGDVAMQSAI